MPRRIPTHTPQCLPDARRLYEGQASRQADKRFYGQARWLRLRKAKLAESPLCEECLRAGRVEPARHVHHVQARKDSPELAFEWSNLESLCVGCHNSREQR